MEIGKQNWEQSHLNERNQSKDVTYHNLGYLNEITKSKASLLIEMISLYLEQTPVIVFEMKKGLQTKNWNSLQRAAHKLVPSFSIMGINQDYENIAKKIQRLANAQMELEKLPDLVAEIEYVCTKVCMELEKELIKFNEMK